MTAEIILSHTSYDISDKSNIVQWHKLKQAWAELGQAQLKLGLNRVKETYRAQGPGMFFLHL